MLTATLLSGLAIAVHLGLGVLVLMRAPRRPVNQCFSVLLFLFFLWSFAELMLICIGTPVIPPGTLPAGGAPPRWLLYLLLTPMLLLPPVFALFTALFPRRLDGAWQLGQTGTRVVLFLPAIILPLLLWTDRLIATADPVEGGFLISLGRFEYPVKIIVVGYLLLAMRTLGLARASLETDFQERRLRYTFAAFVLPAAAGSLFVALGRIYLTGQTMYTYGLFPMLGIAMAAILGYAILRYKLLEIDMFFSIGLVYTLLTATLAGVLELLENGLQSWLNISGATATVVSTLVIAGVFSPLKDLIVAGVDRVFGRRSFDTAGVIRHVLASMRRASTPEAVMDTLLRELHPVLGFQEAALVMPGGTVRLWPVRPPPFPADLPSSWQPAEEIDAVLEAASDNPRLEAGQYAIWRDHGFHWAFQIRRESATQGVFLLAPKPGRLPYTDQERSLVTGLCQELLPVLDTLALLEGLVRHDRAARELEWAERLYAELRNAPERCRLGEYDLILYSSLAREIKGDLIIVEAEASPPFLAVCDAFNQGIAAAVTLHVTIAALRAAPASNRFRAVHENLRRFSTPPLRTALTLVELGEAGLRLHLAGNPLPRFLRVEQPPLPKLLSGVPLGLPEAVPQTPVELPTSPGTVLLVATNGLEKALGTTPDGSLDAVLAAVREADGEILHRQLQERLARRTGVASFPDDISYAIIERRNP